MNKASLLAKFKHVYLSEQNKDVVDPVSILSERLQDVPQLIDKVILNNEQVVLHKPLDFPLPEFTDADKVHEMISLINDMSKRLQIIVNCSAYLTMTAEEALRHGCIYARGQMKELIGGIKALEELPSTIESIRSSILSCERDIQNIRNDVSRTASVLFTIAKSNISAVQSDTALLGV